MNMALGSYKHCSNCEDWHFSNERCAPAFFISHEDYLGDEEKKVSAHSHESAAEKYAVYYNEDGDYSMMNGGDIQISVRCGDTNEVKKFNVSAEPAIQYSSKEIE